MTLSATGRVSQASDWSRLIVEAAPNAMLMIDRQRRIVLVNRKTEELFGYPRVRLLGQTIELLVPERFRDRHPERVGDFFAEPQTRAMGAGRELFGLRADGVEIPIEIGLNPIESPEGPCTLASIIDITERKNAEHRFRLVVEAAPSAMLMVDREGRITLVNRKAEEMFGYTRKDLLGAPIEKLVPVRYRDKHPGQLETFFRQPQARAMGAGRELFGLRANGKEIPIEIGLNPIETPEGLFTLASIIDISERKRADLTHQRLAAIVESSDDAIVSKTLDSIITSWNRGAERLFGYTADEVIGRPMSIVIPERLLEEEAGIMARIRRGEPVDHFVTLRRHKDGCEIDASVTLSPIRGVGHEIEGASSIIRDVSELKRRDAELQRSNAELEQFAYVASHDLQEPLRMVANYTELLAQRYEGKLDEKAARYIHYASDGARRMQRLVADLLAYSRVGSQGKPLVPVMSDGVMRHVLRSLGPLIRESKAVIELSDLPVVMADEGQLGQLFQNLIGNAIKFCSERAPLITVKAVREEACWHFLVSDNGIGMDMQYAERIFQMFQRLHAIGEYVGSGIGLAIAKRIVERHGGTIWVASQPGTGSTFHFTVRAPVADEA